MENLLPQLSPASNRIKTATSWSINNLPEEILSHIISFLPTKDAFRTSVLSKRWIPLCHSLSVLYIEDRIGNSTENRIHLLRLVDAFMFSPHSQHLPLQSFLLNCRSQRWDAKTDSSTLTKWLEAAKRRCVVHLYLCLLYVPLSPTVFCFKTLVTMTLIKMRPDTLSDCSVDLPSLKTLFMFDVRFHHVDDFMKLLSGCPVLERLSTVFVKANVRATENGYFKPLSKLITSAICLFEVPYKAIYNVQLLSISGLGHNLRNKETNSYYKDFPVCENLTVLNLCWSTNTNIHEWDEVVKMLQNCPKLQSLTILKAKNAPTKEDWTYPYHVPQCLSSHLTYCNITDYEAIEADFRFATYILQNARHLQDMSICRSLHLEPMESLRFLDDLLTCSRISPACKLSFSEP